MGRVRHGIKYFLPNPPQGGRIDPTWWTDSAISGSDAVIDDWCTILSLAWWGARCSSVVRAFAHGAMGRRIDPSWGGPIELFLAPASAPRLV